jgi:hypothetical protein
VKKAWRNRFASKEWSNADYLEHWKANCVITPSGCWEWQGFCYRFRNIKPGQRGYAAGCYRGKGVRISRIIAGWKLGRPLTRSEVGMHDCDNHPCINPDHISPGTQKQNKLDEVARGRSFYANKTHCKHGHEFTSENTWHTTQRDDRPRRVCRECSRIKGREVWKKRGKETTARRRIRRQQLRAASLQLPTVKDP